MTLGWPSSPAWTSSGDVACITNEEGPPRLSIPCGAPALRFDPGLDVIGLLGFSIDGQQVLFASPNKQGMVELWSADPAKSRARRLSSFSRDAYAPSVAANGNAIFTVQSDRTFLADAPAAGGVTRQLTTFQSETPSFHPSKRRLASPSPTAPGAGSWTMRRIRISRKRLASSICHSRYLPTNPRR